MSTVDRAINAEGPIGGGYGYQDILDPSEADYTVSSFSGLSSAISSAGYGDIIWVQNGAAIDFGTNRLHVPNGVTIASNRGENEGTRGPVLYTNTYNNHQWANGMITMGSDARITGLRVRGHTSSSGWHSHSLALETAGIHINGSNSVVDNCEVYRWGHSNIFLNDDCWAKHNTSHTANVDGLGYGIYGGNANPQSHIKANYAYHCRHHVADGGSGGYEAYYNIFDPPLIGHVIDQHQQGGTSMDVHHNTVKGWQDQNTGNRKAGYMQRETPSNYARVHHNWFWNPYEPVDNPSGNEGIHRAVTQVDTGSWTHYSSWQNMEYWSNTYGEGSTPPSDVGAQAYSWSEEDSLQIDPPINLEAASIYETSVTLTWDTDTTYSQSDVAENVIYLDGSEHSRVSDQQYAHVNPLDAGTEYTFGVSAVDHNGNETDTTEITATTTAADASMGPPTNLQVTEKGDTYVRIEWDLPDGFAEDDVDHYDVYVDGNHDQEVP